MDILIVDDEKDLCNILTLICLRKNFTVSCAFNLLDALAQIESFPILMFLDNNLTDGVGLEMIEQLKVRSPLTKIVFITASSDLKIKEQAFKRGVDYFLAKPFQLQGVREILSQMLEMQT
jgi:DNA-binding response OmpR family regulator